MPGVFDVPDKNTYYGEYRRCSKCNEVWFEPTVSSFLTCQWCRWQWSQHPATQEMLKLAEEITMSSVTLPEVKEVCRKFIEEWPQFSHNS